MANPPEGDRNDPGRRTRVTEVHLQSEQLLAHVPAIIVHPPAYHNLLLNCHSRILFYSVENISIVHIAQLIPAEVGCPRNK
jgi:hypothetical protein